nr:hypothetical protein [uncultured Algimonas sp.]
MLFQTHLYLRHERIVPGQFVEEIVRKKPVIFGKRRMEIDQPAQRQPEACWIRFEIER